MRKKRIWISILLTVFINILCLPLWTEYDYGSFIRTLFNKEARLDLVYSGKLTGTEPFLIKSVSQPVTTTYWYGYEPRNSRRANLNLRARRKWQKLSLCLESLQDGKITVLLRGPDARNDYDESFAVLTDWRNLKINGKMVFAEPRTFSYMGNDAKSTPETKHELPQFGRCFMFAEPTNFPHFGNHTRTILVKKHTPLQIEVEFRRHPISIHDFTGLQSGKVWYIITGNLLFFFLIYRLLSALADNRGNSRLSDMLLVFAFFPCLFIPVMDISDAVVSVRENRTLSVKPTLKLLRKNSDYGRRYENWFSDHFLGRVSLIKLHNLIRNKLSHIIQGKNAFYIKENRWEFLTSPLKLDYEPSLLRSIKKNILEMNQLCDENGIKLYILEVPSKEIIYKEVLKKYYGFDEKKETQVSQALETIRNEVRKHHIPYIYPYEALRDATRRDCVFFRWAHHWTDWGAFIGYRELMKEINKDFPDMPVASLGDYKKFQCTAIRDEYSNNFRDPFWQLIECLNYAEMEAVPKHTYYDHKNGNKMVVKIRRFTKDFAYPEGRYKIMLIGTSQNENLNHFLPYSAVQTKYIRLNRGQRNSKDIYKIFKLYKKDILAFKPDILVLSISTVDLRRLRDICASK